MLRWLQALTCEAVLNGIGPMDRNRQDEELSPPRFALGFSKEIMRVGKLSIVVYNVPFLIRNKTINRSSMQPARNRNVGRYRVYRGVAQKVNGRAREVVLLAPALVRRREPHLLAFAPGALGLAHAPRHVRVDKAGRDGVDVDAVRRELDAEHLGEHHDAALGGIVRGHAVARQGNVRRLAGDEEDAAGLPLLDQFLGDELDGEECTANLSQGREISQKKKKKKKGSEKCKKNATLLH